MGGWKDGWTGKPTNYVCIDRWIYLIYNINIFIEFDQTWFMRSYFILMKQNKYKIEKEIGALTEDLLIKEVEAFNNNNSLHWSRKSHRNILWLASVQIFSRGGPLAPPQPSILSSSNEPAPMLTAVLGGEGGKVGKVSPSYMRPWLLLCISCRKFESISGLKSSCIS